MAAPRSPHDGRAAWIATPFGHLVAGMLGVAGSEDDWCRIAYRNMLVKLSELVQREWIDIGEKGRPTDVAEATERSLQQLTEMAYEAIRKNTEEA